MFISKADVLFLKDGDRHYCCVDHFFKETWEKPQKENYVKRDDIKEDDLFFCDHCGCLISNC